MIKISSIIITKNEEANIARCITSQLKSIDEIIVIIDEETTDSTKEIVQSFPGVKYQVEKWRGYSGMKKFAVTLTTNEWVLWIDADEALTPQLSNEIFEFKNSAPQHTAYSFPRKAFFLGRWIEHSGWYPGRVVRLFNKTKAAFSDNDVHEHLRFEGTAGKFLNDIEHFTDPTIEHYFHKFNRYTSLAAEELQKKGKTFRLTDITVRPFFIFIKMYFIKRGFLDGIQGFILALFSASYVFTKYAKLWELKNIKGAEKKI
jgi:(heptosyl)LPS beta-1,4-glucosyltransferase